MVKKRLLLWGLFFISGLLLISSYPEDNSYWNPLEQFIIEITAPIQKLLHSCSNAAKELWLNYVYLIKVREENERLKREIEKLRIENMRCRTLRKRVQNLTKILSLRPEPKWQMVISQVIGHDPTGWFRTVIIDKGKRDGIRVNMPVISAEGLVGRVISVSSDYSKVLLITDPDSAIDCLDERTRARGILRGKTASTCILSYVEHFQDIRPGDIIVTSGLSGIFPKGIPVGKVREVKQLPGALFKDVKVTPFVDFSRLEEVLVILKKSFCFTGQSG